VPPNSTAVPGQIRLNLEDRPDFLQSGADSRFSAHWVSRSVIAEKSIVKPAACLRRSCPAFPTQHSPPMTPTLWSVMVAGRSDAWAGPIPKITSGTSSESKVCVPPTPVMSVVPFFAP
jgi:hypothetical protein